jgi:hypothetical protein
VRKALYFRVTELLTLLASDESNLCLGHSSSSRRSISLPPLNQLVMQCKKKF